MVHAQNAMFTFETMMNMNMIFIIIDFYTVALILNTRVEILHRERRTRWVQDMVLETPISEIREGQN